MFIDSDEYLPDIPPEPENLTQDEPEPEHISHKADPHSEETSEQHHLIRYN